MRSVKRLVYLGVLVVLAFTGCAKSDILPLAGGTYTGKLNFSSSLGIVYTHTEKPVYITFDNGNYTTDFIIPNVNSVPLKGTYALKADTAIAFTLASQLFLQVYPPPYKLDAQYKREYKGDSLILTLNIPGMLTTYQYRLKRN
ncbi:hypothetical protein KXQ82_17075 [Mucilaginibacter sp. HMF5004]|uniref:hypothetical protein n=1 Tax=Mucilaginibacter rivuli TaxID=2857527 RepID=UPI001C5DF436|nr:hypothetical protein [Mucilaginibacter rivuli]MBW4891443.1 hypothetical protein [Mucilaginibacter rivuli]